MKNILLILLLILSEIGISQTFLPVKTIKVNENGKMLRNPWAGGMNLPQFSSTDFNGDGKMDLFVFDKDGFMSTVFLNYGSGDSIAFKYSPQYEKFFPPMIRWALMRDFNCDGIGDLFSSCTAGMKLYEGKNLAGNYIYTKVDSPLYSNYMGTPLNIYSANEDIPAIADIDGDGDLDIIVIGSLFRTQLDFYKNTSKETVGTCDSTTFTGPSTCWGKLSLLETSTLDMIFGACKTDGITGVPARGDTIGSYRHSSNSILTFDQDNDGDQDILIGDVAYSTMVFGKNTGSASMADFTSSDALFPNYDTSVNINIFPTGYACDVNGDHANDLIISPNATTSVGIASSDIGNVWYYKNVGPSNDQHFRRMNDSFLVGDMVEVGNSAYPVLFDYNHDSLIDLIVANRGYYNRLTAQYDSKLSLYKNVGTRAIPSFELQTRDYQSLSLTGLTRLRPTYGDVDGDGDLDMLVGDEMGTLTYFENSATSGEADFSSITPLYDFHLIDIGFNATPWLYDVDKDHDLDILVGDINGGVSYYWNFGDSVTALFHVDSVNTNFGNINVRTPAYPDGNATPSMFNDTLYVGSYDGPTSVFLVNQDSLKGGNFVRITNHFGGFRCGNNTNLTRVDFDQDNNFEYLIGNNRGGINIYSAADWDTIIMPDTVLGIHPPLVEPLQASIYPNPATHSFQIELPPTITDFEYSIFNINGQLQENQKVIGINRIKIDISDWSNGAYFVHIKTREGLFNRKLFIQTDLF